MCVCSGMIKDVQPKAESHKYVYIYIYTISTALQDDVYMGMSCLEASLLVLV